MIIWTELVQGEVLCSCEHDNEPYSSIKDRKFLDKVSDYQLFNNSDPWT
jgi:hypothetical protein